MFFKNMESILKDLSSRNLKILEHYYAIDLNLFRAIKDTHVDVYGSHSGNKVTQIGNFRGVLISDDFFPSGPAYAGNFEEGFLYTSFSGVLTADIIAIASNDAKIRRFVVGEKETIGTQDSVFSRFKITNLAN